MFLIKLNLCLFALGLASCNINTIKNHQTANEESEFRSLRTQVISFPNKRESISYRFTESLFDFSKAVEINLIKEEKGVTELINIETYEWDDWKYKNKEYKVLFSENDKLDFFIENLLKIDVDTCLVRNSYSPNSRVTPMIFFVDKQQLIHAFSYNGTVCSFGELDSERTKLESIEYKLRGYLMEIGAWDGLITENHLSNKDLSELNVIDTMYFKRYDMDMRMTKNISLFYPLKKYRLSFENLFIANIDTIPYYKADLEEDSVSYVWNKKGLEESVRFKDADSVGFRGLLKKLSLYEKEEWKVSTKKCLGETEARYIYWNDSALNIIPFECATEKQKIWRLDKEIRDWFEMKFNNQFIVK